MEEMGDVSIPQARSEDIEVVKPPVSLGWEFLDIINFVFYSTALTWLFESAIYPIDLIKTRMQVQSPVRDFEESFL